MLQNKTFSIDLNPETGCVRSIVLQGDPHQMNWVGHTKEWGRPYAVVHKYQNFREEWHLVSFAETASGARSVFENNKLRLTVTRSFPDDARFAESYLFENISGSPCFFRKGEIGIYTPFCDEYHSAAVSQATKCNAHLWCGESMSWVNALRQGESGQNLGLVLTAGSLDAYSIDRDGQTLRTARRGNIILHPEILELGAGASATVSWELFVHAGDADFRRKLAARDGLFDLHADHYTVLGDEPFRFDAGTDSPTLRVNCEGRDVPVARRGGRAYVEAAPLHWGDHVFELSDGARRTHVRLFAAESLETILDKRVHFIVERQQLHRPGNPLDGAYLIYDNEDHRPYFDNGNADHNASRERLGMGILVARYLQTHDDPAVRESLRQYVAFVRREFLDAETGDVFDTIGRDPKRVRLYNAPWMMLFMAELYRLSKDGEYLDILMRVIRRYYTIGGARFYPNGINVELLYRTLADAGRDADAEEAKARFLEHSGNMLKTGLDYPPHEVVFEQTIVTPAVTFICDSGLILGDRSYADKAQAHLAVLERFNGGQPDYHLNGIPIRYWDDFWFGKEQLFADTLPHYWSCLTARSEFDYYRLSGDAAYLRRAENCIRNCLCLFGEDGTGSCAYVYPFRVDNHKGEFFDGWANDQDFALYFAISILAPPR